MDTAAAGRVPNGTRTVSAPVPAVLTGLAFLILFWEPLVLLGRDWWTDPEAGHGLLLGPLALILAWRKGFVRAEHAGTAPTPADPTPHASVDGPVPAAAPVWGLSILVSAVVLRYLSGLAAELFTMRMSMLAAAAGLIVFAWGWRQLLHWWLPAALLLLSVPIPAMILNSLAFPLQLKASQIGATLLEWRHVPVLLAGNVIRLPGQLLFVTEACSGLRSLTALLSLGVLVGGLWLRTVWSRIGLVALSVPIAVVLNGVRVFLMGFLVYYVSPELGEGFLHYTEGWGIFVIAFGLLGGVAVAMRALERRLARRPGAAA